MVGPGPLDDGEDGSQEWTGAESFTGPVFIVGRPRSGTKLLRTLLNEHSRVGIPLAESMFIPSAIRTFGDPPPFSDSSRLRSFYQYLTQTSFFTYGLQNGLRLDEEALVQRADLASWPSIIETILRYYSPKPSTADMIWGDKSPGYLTEMPLLQSLFPDARFIHIIRDPRDHVLSVIKAWKKSPLRAARVWRLEVGAARRLGATMGPSYHELRFEELLQDPESVLANVCRFLDLTFEPAMTTITTSYEDRGDAAGALRIVDSNLHKYRTALQPEVIKRIEEVTYPLAEELGYEMEYADRHVPMSSARRALEKAKDGVAMTRFYVRERGLRRGIEYFIGEFRKTFVRSR